MKAVTDQFDYVCKLSTGETLYFTSATINGDFCTLDGLGHTTHSDSKRDLPHPFPRGLEVRISEIVWCADAPAGS